jgi:RecA-family ATPase
VGKSMMANQIACCIATGTDFLGYIVPKARKVALVQHEMENGEQLDRLKLQSYRFLEMHPDLMTKNLYMHIIEDDENLIVIDQFEVIENTLIIDPDIEVMVFDNIGQSTTVAMTDPDAIRTELKRLKGICRKYDVAFLLVAHHNKIDYNKEMDLKKEHIQGGKPVTDWADNVIQLQTSSINPSLVLFKITKIRSVHDKDGITTKLVNQAVKFNQDKDLLFTNRMAIANWEAHFKATDKYEREMEYLRELARRGEFTTLEALNESATITPPVSEVTIKGRWLPKFCKYGWIEKVKHGHYKVRDEMIMMLNDPTVLET